MIRSFGDIYRTLFGLELSVMFQYRAAVVIWLLGLVLWPVIHMIVWLTVAESKGGSVGDYDAGAIAATAPAPIADIKVLRFTDSRSSRSSRFWPRSS